MKISSHNDVRVGSDFNQSPPPVFITLAGYEFEMSPQTAAEVQLKLASVLARYVGKTRYDSPLGEKR